MKPIKIDLKNTDTIEAALAEVNGRATSFTVTHYYEVARVMRRAEKGLDALPKAARTGATATFIPAGPSANSYKYAAKSTRLSMARRATGWYLTEVAEAHVYPKTNDSLRITISQGQASEISRRAISAFTVLAAAE